MVESTDSLQLNFSIQDDFIVGLIIKWGQVPGGSNHGDW